MFMTRNGNARNQAALNDQLIRAALEGSAETVTALLERGADVNARDNDGYTALIWAAFNGHAEIVTALLERGADVDARNNDGDTALMWAAHNGHAEIATLLRNIATIQKTIPDPAQAGGGDDWLALLPRLAEPMVQLNLHPLAATLAAVILADGSDEGREAVERINLSQVQRGNSALNVKRVERLGELNSTLYPKLLETAKANLTTIHPQETEDDHQGRAEERAKKIDNSVILSLLQPGVLKNISDQFQVSKSGNLKPNLPEQLSDGVILENLLPKLPDATEHEREHVAHAIADFFRKQNEDAVTAVAAAEKRAEQRNKLSKLRTFDDQRVWLPKRPTSSASSSAAATPQSSTSPSGYSSLSIGGKGADGGRGENGEGGGRT